MTNPMHHLIETLSEPLGALIDKLHALWAQALGIWLAGGWAMAGIAVIALVMFGLGMHVHLKLRAKGVRLKTMREQTWRRWIEHPRERRGPLGNLVHAAMHQTSHEQLAAFFEELRTTDMAPFARDLRVMKICVTAAPLVGLLGTVTGMLATFGALASGSSGDKTMGQVAEGISEALITTETGLVIALPGLFFNYQLLRKHERYQAFLKYLETVCSQIIYRGQGPEKEEEAMHGTIS